MNGKERFSPTLFVTPASRPSRVTTISMYEAEKPTPKSLTVGAVVDDHTRIRGSGKRTRNDDSYERYSESRIDGGSKLEFTYSLRCRTRPRVNDLTTMSPVEHTRANEGNLPSA